MTHRFYISQFRTAFLAAGAVAMFAVAGCAKQEAGANGQDCPMSIQPEVVSTDGALKSNDGGATKATLINEAAGLQAQGFGLSIYNDEMAYKDKVTMVYDGGWKPSGGTMDWRWPLKTVYTFYAWSPATLVTDVAASGIQPFTYSGIADQKDIMIGYYSGIGNNGAAPVKFSHALSSVQFKTGTMTGLGNITGIELSGVATSGTCTPTASGSETVNFAWGSFSDNTTLTQSGLTAASTTSGTAIGTPFLVMPQSAALTVKLTDSGSKTVTATISAPALTVGHTAVYTINYDGQTASFTVSIESWTDGQSDEISFGLPKGALPGEFSVSATKKVHFSKGNLYFDGNIFKFEENQYESGTGIELATHIEMREPSHVSHFYWSKDGRVAYADNYSTANTTYGIEPTANDIFFTNKQETGHEEEPNPNFEVDGVTGKYRSLSIDEWIYLINQENNLGSTVRSNKYKLGITVCGKVNCLILLPDDWEWNKNGVGSDWQSEYSETTTVTWATMESVGAVCLPCAGDRPINTPIAIMEIGQHSYYWSSTPYDSEFGTRLHFYKGSNIFIKTIEETQSRRDWGHSIRLVTDIQ